MMEEMMDCKTKEDEVIIDAGTEVIMAVMYGLKAMAGDDEDKAFDLITSFGATLIEVACLDYGVDTDVYWEKLYRMRKEIDIKEKKMVFIIQDKEEGKKTYIASRPTMLEAVQLVTVLKDIDRENGEPTLDRYTIEQREYCYSSYSEKCGNVKEGICMLEDPGTECPLAKARKGKE